MMILLFNLVYSQIAVSQASFITKDSLPFELDGKWKYFPGDSISLAGIEIDDNSWQETNSELRYRYEREGFRDKGWFRKWIRIDTSLLDEPILVRVRQNAASEIYLDGKLVKKFGVIRGKDSIEYINPDNSPFIITLRDTGRHLFAVRYVNYDVHRNAEVFFSNMGGFSIMLSPADYTIDQKVTQTAAITFIYILMFGIFITLAMVHLMLFLYYRVERSNVYFSIFALMMAFLFLAAFIIYISDTPSLIFTMKYSAFIISSLACLSLSAFINEQFKRKRKITFWGISVIFAVVLGMRFMNLNISAIALVVLVMSVSFEAVFTILFAIRRQVKGARIAGAGVLFFTLFILILFGITLISGDLNLNDSTPSGRLMLMGAACAILSMPVSMSAYLAWGFAVVNKDLKHKLKEVQSLSEKMIEQEIEKKRLAETRQEELEKEVVVRTAQVMRQKDEIEKQHTQLVIEKKKSDDLLLNILPSEVAEELKARGETTAKLYEQVSVLFTDIVNFTRITENLTPQELVKEIDIFFKEFDAIITRNGLEKIKTIGDAYLAVCGLPEADPMHAVKVINAAKEILEYVNTQQREGGKFAIRIGIHSGPVVAGIVGVKKFAYDIWGDTVNTAARMEQNSEAGKINISGRTYELVKDKFNCVHRGKIAAKNKGEIDMYFVN